MVNIENAKTSSGNFLKRAGGDAKKLIIGALATTMAFGISGCSSVEAAPEPTQASSSYTPEKFEEEFPPLNTMPLTRFSPIDNPDFIRLNNSYAEYSYSPSELKELAEVAEEYHEKYGDKIDILKIPSGLSDEEFAKEFVDLIEDWWNAVADKNPYKQVEALKMGGYDVSRTNLLLTQDIAFLYMEALGGPDWHENENLREFFNLMWRANSSVVNFSTTRRIWNPEGVGVIMNADGTKWKDYRVTPTIEGIDSYEADSDGARRIVIGVTAISNADPNEEGGAITNIGIQYMVNDQEANFDTTLSPPKGGYEQVEGVAVYPA